MKRPVRYINRSATRRLLLAEAETWQTKGKTPQKNLSRKVLEEIEERFIHYIKAIAGDPCPGRSMPEPKPQGFLRGRPFPLE